MREKRAGMIPFRVDLQQETRMRKVSMPGFTAALSLGLSHHRYVSGQAGSLRPGVAAVVASFDFMDPRRLNRPLITDMFPPCGAGYHRDSAQQKCVAH